MTDAAVVGGGLVGKAAALALAQAGLRVRLCGASAAAELPDAGFAQRIYAFNAASRALLQRLRVWDQLPASRVQPVAAMHIGGDGAALDFDAAAQGVDALAWIAEADAVERALDLALRFERGVDADPRRVGAARRIDDGWRLELDGGGAASCALLLGADGRASRVRQWAGIGQRSRPYGQTAVVANFRIDGDHGDAAYQAFGVDGVIALLPLPQRHVSLVWSAPDVLAAELQRDAQADAQALAARVQRELPRLRAQRLSALHAAGAVGAWPLLLQRAHSLAGAGVALLGDAGHVVHPLAGHGLNLGLQDVQALAAVLAARGAAAAGDARLLRRYARARAEQVLALELATDGLQRLYALPWLAPLRALGLAATDHLSPLKRWLAAYASGANVLG